MLKRSYGHGPGLDVQLAALVEAVAARGGKQANAAHVIKIAHRKNATGFLEVPTDIQLGHYAAHDGVVTHIPTGIAVMRFNSKTEAKSLVKHLHATLGARMFVGGRFGEVPSFTAGSKGKADIDELNAAIRGHGNKLLKTTWEKAEKRYTKAGAHDQAKLARAQLNALAKMSAEGRAEELTHTLATRLAARGLVIEG